MDKLNIIIIIHQSLKKVIIIMINIYFTNNVLRDILYYVISGWNFSEGNDIMKNNKFINYIKDILPGLLVSVAVALVGIFIARFVPKLGAGTISIFLGMFVGNLFLNKMYFKKDINFQRQIYYHIL